MHHDSLCPLPRSHRGEPKLQPRPLRGSNGGRRRLLCAGQACSKFDMIQNETTTQYIGLGYIPSDDVNQAVGLLLSLCC